MTEQQVIEEVLRYIKDQSYNYAILIDGEWGSGKTYFVKNKLKPIIETNEEIMMTKRSFKYISLYGCKSITDIQENIAWSFADIAREKVNKKDKSENVGERVSESIFLTSRKIGNLILKKAIPDNAIYDIAFDWLSLRSFIFVFDDLERCDCPINEVFGFLNGLVEHEQMKVILIANEKELSKTAKTQSLELQYQLTLDERIEWPKKEDNSFGRANFGNNSKLIPLKEMERRRELLFPANERNTEYHRICEKLIGVSLKYEADIPTVISKIIDTQNINIRIKEILNRNKKEYVSTMKYYQHNNIRTFQFFLSKVVYLLENLNNNGEVEKEYYETICNHIVVEAFSDSVKYKSNCQPPRDNRMWFNIEQETKFQSIKQYIESGTFDQATFNQETLTYQGELKAQITTDDPYYLLYQQYYFHSQAWCEEQIEKILWRLSENKYPISLYTKIIVIIQRLIDLGFHEDYMDRVKSAMLENITNMQEIDVIDPDLWYIDDSELKEKVNIVIADLNIAITNQTEKINKETIAEILLQDTWIEQLERYLKPNKSSYIQDIAVFSQASSEQWVNNLNSASPEDIDDFRHLLNTIYPRNVIRKAYSKDEKTMKDILKGLKELQESDLIKKACIKWLCSQFEAIIELHEHINEASF